MNAIQEQDILDKSKLSLKQIFGDELFIKDKPFSNKNSIIDGVLKINSVIFHYIIVSQTRLERLLNAIESNEFNSHNNDYTPLIIIDYATKGTIDLLKEKQVFFIDSSGNCYINLPNFKIHVEGKKNEVTPYLKKKRAFQKTGLKLIYQLFIDSSLTNLSYREISTKTDVSLASVSYIFDELKEDGFITEVSGTKKNLSNIQRLIQKWSISYAEILRPKIHRGYLLNIKDDFRFNDLLVKIDKNEVSDFFIGGEYAANLLNNSIKPQKVILYSNERLSKIADKYNLVPITKLKDNKFEIEILEKFWLENNVNQKSISNKINLVDPILIYADLIASNNHRSVITAEQILKNEVRNKFRKHNLLW